MSIFRSLPCVAAASLLAFAACSRAPGDHSRADIVEIGATLPLSGGDSAAAVGFREGYELAFDETNARGGLMVAGAKEQVHLRLFDDRGVTESAALLAERLIAREGVSFMLGTYGPQLVAAQSRIAEQSGILYVSGADADPQIYRGARWVYGLLPSPSAVAESLMRWVQLEQNAGKLASPLRIAVLWQKTPHGRDFERAVLDFAARSGVGRSSYQVVFDESFEPGSPDAKHTMQRLKAANAHAFLADAQPADFLTLHRQYAAEGLCHQLVSYGPRGADPQALEQLGREEVSGIVSAAWWSSDFGGDVNRAFVQSYAARYRKKPQWYAALGYESARALFSAIERAGSLDRERVRDALASTEMASILAGGRLSFAAGQSRVPLAIEQNDRDGTIAILSSPSAARTRAAVVPECLARVAAR